MLRRALRFLWKFCKWTVLTVLALVVLAVLINLRDEPLSEEARALLADTPAHVPDRENILVAMAGIGAPEGEDVFLAGRRYLEEADRASYWDANGLTKTSEQKKAREGRLSWKKTEPPFGCPISEEKDFLQCIESEKDRLAETLALNKTLVQRYRSMQELPYYAAILPPGQWTFAIDYSTILSARRPLLAQAMLDIKKENTEAGLEFFKKDMALWRRILEKKNHLFDSVIAMSALTQDARGISVLLSSPSVTIAEGRQQEWRALLAPLTPEQQSFHAALQGELKLVYKSSIEMKRWKSYREFADEKYHFCGYFESDNNNNCKVWQMWLGQNIPTRFFQPAASFNDSVPYYKAWLKLTDLSWNDYLAQRDATLAPFNVPAEPRIDWVYNPIGKLSVGVYFSYDDYIGRFHDADTYLRLLRLQLELRLAQVPSGQVAGFLKQLDAPYCAPCSDFSWNAETRALAFQPYNKGGLAGRVPPSAYLPEAAAQGH